MMTRELRLAGGQAGDEVTIQLGGTPVLRAELVFDSWKDGLREARRGGTADTRQLAYCTQVVDIALTLLAKPNRTISVAGQLFPSSGCDETFDVEMVGDRLRTGEVREFTHADDLGEFWLDGLPSGAYHLVLTTPSLGILVTPIELPELAA
jgi:hypothetical protein